MKQSKRVSGGFLFVFLGTIMYIKAKGGMGRLLEMLVFLHMIVVRAKASWLNKLEVFCPILNIQSLPAACLLIMGAVSCAKLYLSNLYKQSLLQRGYRWSLAGSP